MAGFLLKLLPVFLLVLTLSMTTSKTIEPLAASCPETTGILPCTCYTEFIFPRLTCQGPLITQGVIDNLFTKVRATLPSPGERLIITKMEIKNTTLKRLDMTPFLNTYFMDINIQDNPELAEISGSNAAQFEVNTFSFINAALTDTSLAKLLTFVDATGSELLGFFQLDGNKIEGSNFDAIFAPFPSIRYLYLDTNQIKTIGGGQFRHFKGLKSLSLRHNRIGTVGPDAFRLHEEAMTGTDPLDINLAYNQLTDDNVNVDHGLDKIERKVGLVMDNNQFEFITAEKFGNFLLADTNLDNQLRLWGNNFVCDDDKLIMWLRNANDKLQGLLEGRVSQAYCADDVGETIFTTKFPKSNNHGVTMQAHHVLTLILVTVTAKLLSSN